MKNKPAYAIESVDRALRLATLLQHEGVLRVSDAAQTLGISVSGAHRLLSMLVYRDYAERLPDRRYGPGAALRAFEPNDAPLAQLRLLGTRHLPEVVHEVRESANLMVRIGQVTRFVVTVETDRPVRVGDRTGTTLPAHRSSGGKALLALLDLDELTELYAEPSDRSRPSRDVHPQRLYRSLRRVATDGYAVNRGETEDSVSAIGLAVRGSDGLPVCALSVSMPSSRFAMANVPRTVALLRTAAGEIEGDLRRLAQ